MTCMRRIVPAATLLALLCSAPALAQANFPSCLAGLRADMAAKGVSTATFDAAMQGVQPDMNVIELMNKQPEFKTPIWDYMAALVDDERIARGPRHAAQWKAPLARAQQRFGVDRAASSWRCGASNPITAVNGGTRPLVQSLATLSCYAGRRQAYFRSEFFNDAEDHPARRRRPRPPHGLLGRRLRPHPVHALDFPAARRRRRRRRAPRHRRFGAGRSGVHGQLPAQGGLGRGRSAGATRRGCRRASTRAGRSRKKRALSVLGRDGREPRRRLGASSGDQLAASCSQPAARGPAFRRAANFDAIYSYNAAESYALAIAHLSDRIRGGGPIATPWPTDDPGLSRAERRELQVLLTRRGFDVGEPDGAIGDKTRAAVAQIQSSIGLAPNGRPSAKVLERCAPGGEARTGSPAPSLQGASRRSDPGTLVRKAQPARVASLRSQGPNEAAGTRYSAGLRRPKSGSAVSWPDVDDAAADVAGAGEQVEQRRRRRPSGWRAAAPSGPR